MQLSQVLTLASAATVLAKVHNDNSPIPASVPRPSNTATMHASGYGVWGTAVGAVSARLHPKDLLQAQASSIFVCEHADFGGNCVNIDGLESGVCYNLNSSWNDVISSTDTNGHTCTVFEHQGCTGDQSTVNGRVNWGYMNDKITSLRCFD
ncbi:hypothetical protein DM02DRAFT_540064 [Periconia macrospinosa]|uniref:Beta/gamma crystallin 'Greek key' domain-containing protein n=1 Tax=Periconia macrospinosa TaxID=97972 RepID=A0A2V1D7P5_9PLEO|nr:hypothetical protein DM02DRAFT_540064 [Periconia macrospinosa]